MTKEFELRKYNMLCAELLGYVNKTLDDKVFNIHEHPITKHMIETNFTNVFKEDWNWIMMVKNTIVDLDLSFDSKSYRFYFSQYACKKYHADKEYKYKTRIYTDFKTLEFKTESNNEKEAVVLAIWEFLNWYNDNKNYDKRI